MQVSGWDAEEDFDDEPDPHSSPVKEILWAAQHNEVDVLKDILSKDPSLVNTRDKDRYTPLHRACYNGHLKAVDILLQHGADVYAETEMGWQPLHSACKWNHAKCAARLLQHGADINARSDGDQTPLHLAASHSHCKDILQVLLMHPNVKPEILNVSNETAAQIAKRSCKYYSLFDLVLPAIRNF